MNAIFKKLNFSGHKELFIHGAPESFLPALEEMEGLTRIVNTWDEIQAPDFVLAFVRKQEEVDRWSTLIPPCVPGDFILWFAYPKGSSKRYTCEFNRDTGWSILGKQDFEPVRIVAIDGDWSALRFRRMAYIKNMTRKGRMAK